MRTLLNEHERGPVRYGVRLASGQIEPHKTRAEALAHARMVAEDSSEITRVWREGGGSAARPYADVHPDGTIRRY